MTGHEEFEVGHHLDQALRAAMTGAAQLIERHARTQQQRDRDRADTERAAAMDTRRAVDDWRREWLDQRDSARALYSPWTRPGVVERGDRAEAARAWAQAAGWAEQDPRAAAASTDLHRRIVDAHGTDPQSILASIDGPNHEYALPAGWITMREAVDLANEEAPYYYHRHENPRLGRLDQRPNGDAQQELWTDWQHWAEHGQLPQVTLHEAWAEHNHRDDEFSTDRFLTDAGVVDYPARSAALAEYWQTTAPDRERGALEQHLLSMRQEGLDPASLPIYDAETNPIDTNPIDASTSAALANFANPDTFDRAEISEAVQAWRTAAIATRRDPNDQHAADAHEQLREQFRRRWQVDPATYLADAQANLRTIRTDTDRAQQTTNAAAQTQVAAALTEPSAPDNTPAPAAIDQTRSERKQVEVPAGAANPDRGIAPSKAESEAERAHRAGTWALAQRSFAEEHRTQHPDQEPTAPTQAWQQLSNQQKYERYWRHYDTPEARQVTISADAPDPVARATEQRSTPDETGVPAATAGASAVSARAGEERGFAPSKAGTAAEKAHRSQAWAAAEAEFRKTLPPGTSSEGAGKAWQALDWPDKALRYWTAYDDPEVRRAAGLPAQPSASGPAAGQTNTRQPNQTASGAPAAEPAISRERVIELNNMAADYFADNLRPGTRGHDYLAGRLGTEQLSQDRWRLGYAPAGWTNLTGHLRRAGASNEEITAAGLGRVSSRGNVIDAFRDRAMLGIRDQSGELVGFTGRDLSGDARAPKYVNTEGTPAYRKGDHLFGLAEAPPGARLARAEGSFDAMAITAAGNGEVAGVAPLGTAMTDTQAGQLAGHGPVLLALDNDKGGRAAAEKDFWSLSERQLDVRHVALPEGTDPATLWETNPDALRTALSDPDQAPTAGRLVIDNAIAEHRPRLAAGDNDALLELAYTQGEVSEALTNPTQQQQLADYTQNQIDQLRASGDQDRSSADRHEQHEQRAEYAADSSHDPERAEHLDHVADRADQAEDYATGRAEHREADAAEASEDLDLSARPYNRADTLSPDLDDDVREARQVSAYGYTRPTREMLGEAEQHRGRQAKPSPSTQQTGRVRTQRR